MTPEASQCPKCEYFNESFAERCERCGAQLVGREEDAEAPLNLELPLEDAYTRYVKRQSGAAEALASPGPRWGGFARRGLAFAIDLVVLLVLSSVLFYLVYVGFRVGMAAHPETSFGDSIFGLIRFYIFGQILLCSGYFVLSHGMEGKTFGKWLLGLRVVGARQRSIGYGRAFVRWVGYFPALFSFGLGFLWVVFSREKRGWHDLLAGTWVIRE